LNRNPANQAGKVNVATPRWFHNWERKSRPKMSNLGPKLVISASIIALQSLVIWALSGWSIFLLLNESAKFLISAMFLIGLLLAAGLWSSNIAWALIRKKRWAHTPALVFELLVVSIGVASFAGEFGDAVIGLALLVPATLVFVLLFSKSIREQFQR
jgi:hypothetical protein